MISTSNYVDRISMKSHATNVFIFIFTFQLREWESLIWLSMLAFACRGSLSKRYNSHSHWIEWFFLWTHRQLNREIQYVGIFIRMHNREINQCFKDYSRQYTSRKVSNLVLPTACLVTQRNTYFRSSGSVLVWLTPRPRYRASFVLRSGNPFFSHSHSVPC